MGCEGIKNNNNIRVLHYLPGLPPVRGGGMIKYALDIIEGEQKSGCDTFILIPGRFSNTYHGTGVVRTKWKKRICYSIVNALPVSEGRRVNDIESLYQEGNQDAYIDFLKKINPDIIHLHSIMGLHLSFLKAAREMHLPVVYTTHDYYGICPSAILLNDMKQCTITDGSKCSNCVTGNLTEKKIRFEHSLTYRALKSNGFVNWLEYSQKLVSIKIAIRAFMNKTKMQEAKLSESIVDANNSEKQKYCRLQTYYREMFQYVTGFHYNSTQSKEVFEKHLENISGEVIPISNKNITDNRMRRKYGKTLRIGFIGRGTHKGFDILKDVINNLYLQGMEDIECHVYFNPKERLPPYFISHRPFHENEAYKVYNNIDILVLPSLWKETFGMVVLEALSYGVPVIVSEKVGARELLQENSNMGIVVKPKREELQSVLKDVYCNREILEKMNRAICEWKTTFDYDKHVNMIVHFYNTLIEKGYVKW